MSVDFEFETLTWSFFVGVAEGEAATGDDVGLRVFLMFLL